MRKHRMTELVLSYQVLCHPGQIQELIEKHFALEQQLLTDDTDGDVVLRKYHATVSRTDKDTTNIGRIIQFLGDSMFTSTRTKNKNICHCGVLYDATNRKLAIIIGHKTAVNDIKTHLK